MAGTATTFRQSRQVTVDAGSLVTILYSVVYLLIFIFLLNWFYQAVKRIEKSLKGIEGRLEAIEAGPSRSAGSSPVANPPAPPQPSKKRERISNMWVIPAILFIVGLFSGSLGLTTYLFYGAGMMLIVAAVWEVIRREM